MYSMSKASEGDNILYLEVWLSDNGEMESELEWRIGMAATAAGALREPVFENKELSKEAKLTVNNAVVVPTLVYDCEAWVLKERDKMRMQTMEMKVFEEGARGDQIGLCEK